MRISNSFSEGEIQLLEFILQTLLRGGTPNMATRHKEFASLCRKVMAMRNKANQAQTAGAKERPAPEKSSVGTIDAVDASAEGGETDDGIKKAI